MRLNIISSALAILALGMASNAQAQCPDQYMGTARMYPFETIRETPAPKGYKPAYISHYGRHGARYNTDHKAYDIMYQAFQSGHDLSSLTDFGEETYQRYLKAYPELKNHHGDLCRTGELQQRQLADRMVDSYPGVFRGNVTVDACASIVPRAIVSMAAFCTQLQKRCPKAEINQRSYSSEMLRLNGVAKENPMMQHPAIMSEMIKMYGPEDKKEKNPELDNVYNQLLSKFFTDLTILEPLGGSEKVALAIFDAVQHMPESEDKMDDIFSESVYKRKLDHSNKMFERMYTQKIDGDISLFGCLTSGLMEDFVEKKNEDMKDGISVRLRFGHDMVLFGILALMEIDDWADRCNTSDMPMASNLKMVVYTKKGDEDLVKFIFNDKECKLPIQSDIAPYYKWSDVEDYCSNISSRVSALLEK